MKLSSKYDYPKEINSNLDKIKNPFQRLKKARKENFDEVMKNISSIFDDPEIKKNMKELRDEFIQLKQSKN